MYKEIDIRNFRTLNHLNIKSLNRINIITGINGVGKTSLLEAIFLLSGGTNTTLLLGINGWRGNPYFSPKVDYQFRSFFNNMDDNNNITLAAKWKKLGKKSPTIYNRTLNISPIKRIIPSGKSRDVETFIDGLQFEYKGERKLKQSSYIKITNDQKNPIDAPTVICKELIDAKFITPRHQDVKEQVTNEISSLIKKRRLPDLVKFLKNIEPDLEEIISLPEYGLMNVYGDLGFKYFAPIHVLGGGFYNYLRIALDAFETSNGCLLIDEIEDGIHFSKIDDLLYFLIDIARRHNIQIFATTHSSDLINTFIDISRKSKLQNFGVIKLMKVKGSNIAKTFGRSEVDISKKINLELR